MILGGVHLDHAYMRPWLDPLGDTVQMVFIDHRGIGRSRQRDLSGVTHATWADDVEAIRRARGFDAVFLMGHSYGGFLALEYALRHPASLRGLILCSTAAVFDYAQSAFALASRRATPQQLQLLVEAFSAPIADDATVRRISLAVNSVYCAGSAELCGQHFAAHADYSAAAFNRAYFHCLQSYDVAGRLGEIRVPVLILCGRHDWVTPVNPAGERLATGLPGAQFEIFEESGHYPFIEEQERFVGVVRAWLQRAGAEQ
jgi:proline iminopeptidase